MRIVLASAVCGIVAFATVGCTVEEHGAPGVAVEASVGEGPLFEGAGVEYVDVEPPPPDRVYVYDPGFPPGTYLYNGYYWYGDYRYPRDVFINRVVDRNVREHRYVNVTENRKRGEEVERRDRTVYARTGGKHAPAARQAGEHQPNRAVPGVNQPAEHRTVLPGVKPEARPGAVEHREAKPEIRRTNPAVEHHEARPEAGRTNPPAVEHREAKPEAGRPNPPAAEHPGAKPEAGRANPPAIEHHEAGPDEKKQ